MSQAEDPAVTRFREYLRINTVQPKPDYPAAVTFLSEQGRQLKCDVKVIEPVADRPFVILTRTGTDSSLKSVVFYSHIDVVPVFEDHWTYPPFSAHKDDKGDIYARGAQDMKCVGSQHLEGLRRLMNDGEDKFVRTLHIIFGPDEEIGGVLGMKVFVDTPEFAALNIGVHMDEGLASPDDTYIVYNAERCPMKAHITVSGSPGHGSLFIENTAGEKVRRLTNSFLAFRALEEAKHKAGASMGTVTSINLTMINGGVQANVLPDKMHMVFDVRIPPTVDFDEFFKMVEGWCKEAGGGVLLEWKEQTLSKAVSSVEDGDPWWDAFSGVLKKNNQKTRIETFVGGTDARFVRKTGIPAYGYSPMINTPVLLHDHNEFLNEQVFLNGVDIFKQIIKAMANVPKHDRD